MVYVGQEIGKSHWLLVAWALSCSGWSRNSWGWSTQCCLGSKLFVWSPGLSMWSHGVASLARWPRAPKAGVPRETDRSCYLPSHTESLPLYSIHWSSHIGCPGSRTEGTDSAPWLRSVKYLQTCFETTTEYHFFHDTGKALRKLSKSSPRAERFLLKGKLHSNIKEQSSLFTPGNDCGESVGTLTIKGFYLFYF